MLASADEFAGEDSDVLVCLFGHGGVALGAFVGLEDVGFCFLFSGFQGEDVAVEFADICADEGIAFPFLHAIRTCSRDWRTVDGPALLAKASRICPVSSPWCGSAECRSAPRLANETHVPI